MDLQILAPIITAIITGILGAATPTITSIIAEWMLGIRVHQAMKIVRKDPQASDQQIADALNLSLVDAQPFINKAKDALNKAKPRPSFLQPVSGGIVGVLIGFVLGYFLIVPLFFSSCPFFAPTSVTITSPLSGSSEPRQVAVEGTSCHIPQGEDLWVLVVPDADASHYYPQPGPATVSSSGDWNGSAYAGQDLPVEVGKGFELVIVLADPQGSAAIRTHLDPSPPIPAPLPKGIQVMKQVHIVRK